MKLPDLPELPSLPDLNEWVELEVEKTTAVQVDKNQVNKKKELLRKQESTGKKENEDLRRTEKREMLKLPKSKYGEDGIPILTVPGIDDINLKEELNKYFK